MIPAVKEKISIPVIAAGGIGTGRQMFAAMVLGTSAVQMGSRFIASNESSCHLNFKKAVISSQEGDTELCLKKLTPVRLLKNKFYNQVKVAEESNIGVEELTQLLGTRRAKKGMFEGNMNDGELEIGQVCTLIQSIKPAKDIVNEIWNEYNVLLIGFRK